MSERQKVIRGLECHKAGFYEECLKCPYHDDGCEITLCNDAIALLREQEPRVMTKSEAISYPEMQNAFDESDKPPLYVEYKTSQSYFVKWVSVENIYLWMNDFELNMDYGKEFRFWTSRPTEEQRKEVKWVE